jgi:four helix bundle protein
MSYDSVWELEKQILLARDLDLIEKSELDTVKKDIVEIERMLRALIKYLGKKPLNPGPLESLAPLLQLN